MSKVYTILVFSEVISVGTSVDMAVEGAIKYIRKHNGVYERFRYSIEYYG